jgi:hypothetical protein
MNSYIQADLHPRISENQGTWRNLPTARTLNIIPMALRLVSQATYTTPLIIRCLCLFLLFLFSLMEKHVISVTLVFFRFSLFFNGKARAPIFTGATVHAPRPW